MSDALAELLRERELRQALEARLNAEREIHAIDRASLERYRRYVETSTEGVWEIDMFGCTVFANARMAEMLGYSEGLMGRNAFDLIHPDDLGKSKDSWERRKRGISEMGEWRFLKKDGTCVWLQRSGTPVRNANGEIIGAFALFTDITDKKKAEEDLERRKGDLRKQAELLDLAHDAILVRDMQNRIEYWNGGAEKTYGWKADEVLGRETHTLFQTEFPVPFSRIETALIECGEWQGELVHRCRDGTAVYVDSRWVLRRDDQGKPVNVLEINRNIQLRKKAEALVRESETKLKAILNNVAALVYVKGRDGRYLLANRNFEETLGLQPNWILGKTDFDYTDSAAAKSYVDNDAKIISTGQADRFEEHVTLPDGRHTYVSLKFPLRDTNGEIYAVCGVSTDITENKRAEALLREREERLRAALSASGTGTFRWNIQTNALDWDDALDRLFGLQPGATARSLSQFIGMVHPEDRAGVSSRCERCAREGADFTMEFRVVWPDGSIHWLDDRGKTFFDEEGKPLYMTGACVDITERKATQEQLQELETRQRIMIEHLPVGIWFLDEKGSIVYGNKSGQEIWRGVRYVPLEELHVYKAWWHHTGEALPPEQWAGALAVREKRTTLNQILDIQCFDGTRKTIINSAVPIQSVDGEFHGAVVFNLDITEEARTQAELRESHERLEQRVAERTAKLEETIGDLEAFSYSISHDLRTPLRAMRGFSEMLLAEHNQALTADGQDLVRRISRAAIRLDGLIQDVLSYSRVANKELALTEVNLDRIVADVIESEPNLQEPLGRVIVDAPLGSVMGHSAFLTQMFSNLLGNAVKFVRPGLLPEIRIRSERAGEKVRVWVEDNGIGIAPEHFEQIFTIFGRIHPEKLYEGSGIGLAITRKAVERMGGEIGVESILENGSKFWFTLQRHHDNR